MKPSAIPKLDTALDRLRGFKPRRETPCALLVKVDGEPIRFKVNKTTGKVADTPKGSFWEFARGLAWNDFKRFLDARKFEVELE